MFTTYICSVLGCLTAMSIHTYGKIVIGRWKKRRPLFRDSGYDSYSDNW
jgi:hypothetical protein